MPWFSPPWLRRTLRVQPSGQSAPSRGGWLWIWGWSASLALVWILVAWRLDQSILQDQPLRAQKAYGLLKGSDLSWTSSWRLLPAQWLHLKLLHMAWNALLIGLVGSALARRFSAWRVLVFGLLAGVAGETAAAITMPQAFLSGASQAAVGLCGLALSSLAWRRPGWWIALAGALVAVGLDLHADGSTGVKPGHSAPLLLGLLAGGLLLLRRPARPAVREPNSERRTR